MVGRIKRPFAVERRSLPERQAFNAGWRVIGGNRSYYRSRWEANYARYLEWLKDRGEIKNWEHEPETFWFLNIMRGVRSYLPDFRVTENGGKQTYHEVKGWMDAKSKTKIKRMRIYHPSVTLIVIEKGAYDSITQGVSRLIPDWEGMVPGLGPWVQRRGAGRKVAA